MARKAVIAGVVAAIILLIVSCAPQQKIMPIKKAPLPISSGESGEDEAEPEDEFLSPEESEESKGAFHTVIIKDFRLIPSEITIQAGDTVVWKNEDEWKPGGMVHQLIGHLSEFKTEKFYKGQSVEQTFNKPGVFVYFDVLYKERDLMEGKIMVEE